MTLRIWFSRGIGMVASMDVRREEGRVAFLRRDCAPVVHRHFVAERIVLNRSSGEERAFRLMSFEAFEMACGDASGEREFGEAVVVGQFEACGLFLPLYHEVELELLYACEASDVHLYFGGAEAVFCSGFT